MNLSLILDRTSHLSFLVLLYVIVVDTLLLLHVLDILELHILSFLVLSV